MAQMLNEATAEVMRFPRLQTPRTKIADRELPDYTKGEEIFNMVTHIVGAVFGVLALVLCIIKAAIDGSVWGIVTGAIYGASMILVYTISSVYHGLSPEKANFGKKVMQVIDHCDIYCLIIGTYAPIALTGLRKYNTAFGWTIFGIVTGVCLIGMIFTAIDFNKYKFISYASYFVAGWCVVLTLKQFLAAFPVGFFLWILIGGIVYTSGMIFYVWGNKHRYGHSIFHLFILGGSALQFVGVLLYCM